jgi:aryl-alcohol dehydrogenase-like predicted oxidoreductase
MEHIELGKSDLVTSRIGLGTWAMGGWMWVVPTRPSRSGPFTPQSIVA